MKIINRIIAFLFCFNALHTTAQNVFPAIGNVGIGIDVPAHPLHVKTTYAYMAKFENPNPGAGNLTDAFVFFSNKYGTSQISSWQHYGARIGARSVANGGQGNVYLTTGNDAVRIMIQNSTGNVGIGTETPAFKLDVNNPKSRVATNGFGGITFEQQAYPNQGALLFSSDRTGYTFSIGNKRNSDGNVLPIITMYDQGNVGIGTTTPTAPLTISGNNRAFIDFTETINKKTWRLVNRTDQLFAVENVSGGGAPFVINQAGNIGIGTLAPAAKLHVTYPDGYATLMLGQNNATGFHLVTEGSTFNIYTGVIGAGINRLRIASNGNVGIGTAYPGAYKLAVEGKIGAREIDVKQGSWADFVFKDDYKLRSLEEVEKFINKNKHLPDVPSEKEVTEKGINLGNMDATLLQKIEELTLYLIELKKENIEQNKSINDLKNENKSLTNLLKSVKSK